MTIVRFEVQGANEEVKDFFRTSSLEPRNSNLIRWVTFRATVAWRRMGSGGLRGLQNRCFGAEASKGWFDSDTPPPLLLHAQTLDVSRSAEDVFGAGDQHARAAGLAPHVSVGGRRFGAVVITGVKLPLVDPQLAIEKKQLLDPRMGVRRVLDARSEEH